MRFQAEAHAQAIGTPVVGAFLPSGVECGDPVQRAGRLPTAAHQIDAAGIYAVVVLEVAQLVFQPGSVGRLTIWPAGQLLAHTHRKASVSSLASMTTAPKPQPGRDTARFAVQPFLSNASERCAAASRAARRSVRGEGAIGRDGGPVTFPSRTDAAG